MVTLVKRRCLFCEVYPKIPRKRRDYLELRVSGRPEKILQKAGALSIIKINKGVCFSTCLLRCKAAHRRREKKVRSHEAKRLQTPNPVLCAASAVWMRFRAPGRRTHRHSGAHSGARSYAHPGGDSSADRRAGALAVTGTHWIAGADDDSPTGEADPGVHRL